jgi:hypothetical protein
LLCSWSCDRAKCLNGRNDCSRSIDILIKEDLHLGNVIKAKDNSVDTREMMMTKMNIRSDQEQEACWVECPMTLRADVEAYKGKDREIEGEAGTLGNLHKEESKLARMVQLLS